MIRLRWILWICICMEGGKVVNTYKLKAAIYAEGYNMKRFAEALGINSNLFSKKISGRVGFTMEQAIKTCQLLNLSQEEAQEIFLPKGFANKKP